MAPYRAVTFGSGKELWRLPVPKTASYSRDTDGSGFFLDGRQYIGVESGWFYALDPLQTTAWNGFKKPQIVARRLLLGDERAAVSRRQPRARIVGLRAGQPHLHRLRGRSRVRHAAR